MLELSSITLLVYSYPNVYTGWKQFYKEWENIYYNQFIHLGLKYLLKSSFMPDMLCAKETAMNEISFSALEDQSQNGDRHVNN